MDDAFGALAPTQRALRIILIFMTNEDWQWKEMAVNEIWIPTVFVGFFAVPEVQTVESQRALVSLTGSLSLEDPCYIETAHILNQTWWGREIDSFSSLTKSIVVIHSNKSKMNKAKTLAKKTH